MTYHVFLRLIALAMMSVSLPAFASDIASREEAAKRAPTTAEAAAIAALRESGATIVEWPGGAARFLRVDNARAGFTDQHMPPVGELKQLEGLGLWGTRVTDVGLAHTKELRSLRSLDLNDHISDASLFPFETLFRSAVAPLRRHSQRDHG
ncbi:MAG: hypothetical protein O3C40_14610 [Planctomycetota bacterium]|nr:hypothetical protein [Planctomycetota bacterium]